ncbi:Prefoldin [Umbelopsis sp. PMI_123]|nr:Prefoldin [Umbelopsis sp. PMI_123]
MSAQVIEAKLEAESRAFQKLQKDLTKAVESRQQLDSQRQENELVKKEFDLLENSSGIYKLVGPVLVKQDRTEAFTNVKNRLDLINAEIKRVEAQLQDLTQKSEKKRTEIMQLQSQFQELRAK